MLIAKLKNPVKYQVQILPNKYEERIGDYIKVILDSYQLGIKEFQVRVELMKESLEPLNPSSEVEGEQVLIKKYEMIFIYNITLNEEDLSKWGYDDSQLLYVAAEKLGIEIESIIDTEEEKQK